MSLQIDQDRVVCWMRERYALWKTAVPRNASSQDDYRDP